MRIFLLFLAIIFIVVPLSGKQIFKMPEIIKPFRINVDEKNIYLGDGATIYILSKKDGKIQKKFGKAGEGPREFKLYPEFSPELDVQKGGILASSIGRISYFSKDGEFKWEKKSPGYAAENFNRFLGRKIIGQRVTRDGDTLFVSLSIFDLDFSSPREFHRHKYYLQTSRYNPIQRGIYISNFYTANGKIYVGGPIDSGKIHVYGPTGEKIKVIQPPLKKVPFTGKDKQDWIDSYTSNDEYKRQFERLKKFFDYPEFFPLFQNFIVADKRIYIQTFKRNDKKGTNESIVLDLEGKVIKKIWIPLVEFWDFTPNPYTIQGGKLYQVVENPESEEWEIHITPIG